MQVGQQGVGWQLRKGTQSVPGGSVCMPLDFLGLYNRAVVCRFTVLIKHPGLSSVRSDGRQSAALDRGTDTLEEGRRAQPPPWGCQPLRHSAGDRAGHREPLMAKQIRNMVPAEGTEPWRMIIKLLAASQAAKQTRSKSTRFCLQSGGPPLSGGMGLSAATS